MPRCVTPGGVYDLGGNVAEWAGVGEAQAVQLGGNYRSKDKSGCFRPNATFGPGHKNIGIGFRCCSDKQVPNPGKTAVSASAPDDMVGKKVPKFKGALVGGGDLNSRSFKGKVTYVTFFASWCGPCRKELPALMTLQDTYESQGFQVVAIGVDTVARKSEIFAKRTKVDYPVILDPSNRILGQFDVTSMPTSYLVGRDGVIRYKKVGFGDKTIGEITPEIEKQL
jgi:peroxiredoxin